MSKTIQYQKYVYWLKEDDFIELKDMLSEKGINLREAKKAVCIPLAKGVEIGFVPTDAWQKYELCKRQLSWYRTSPHFGSILVVSSQELDEYNLIPETIIRERKFRPPKLPDRDKKLNLIKREGYQQAKPPEWENIHAEDPSLHDRWLKIMGVRGVTYEEVFITHCANHANFIDPVYFIMEENGSVPFSIDKTTHICSACLEFFNIIGNRFKKKLVVPCPGAVLFAGMAPNRYYEVIQP